MPGYGGVYVEVDASIVNGGIATLAASGTLPGDEGGEYLQAWIRWTYDETGHGGFSGHGWFWEAANNPLNDVWIAMAVSGYTQDEEGFCKYLADTTPENLNAFLGNWDPTEKSLFVNANLTAYGIYPYVESACIEIHN